MAIGNFKDRHLFSSLGYELPPEAGKFGFSIHSIHPEDCIPRLFEFRDKLKFLHTIDKLYYLTLYIVFKGDLQENLTIDVESTVHDIMNNYKYYELLEYCWLIGETKTCTLMYMMEIADRCIFNAGDPPELKEFRDLLQTEHKFLQKFRKYDYGTLDEWSRAYIESII